MDGSIHSDFEQMKKICVDGTEYWYARELQTVLGYFHWRTFQRVIQKAKTACEKSGFGIDKHFQPTSYQVTTKFGRQRKIEDIRLSRYACYMVIQNANPRNQAVALACAYLLNQTRKQEMLEKKGSADIAEQWFLATQAEEKLKRLNMNQSNTYNQVYRGEKNDLHDSEYQNLVEQGEMLEDIRDYDRVKSALEKGEEEIIPADIAYRILDGSNGVKVWREYRKMTQQQVAEASGISVSYLAKIEAGKRIPSISVMSALAKTLHVAGNDLFAKDYQVCHEGCA